MEEKLFELMAQAEDLQNHAAKLQKEAQEVFSALPLAVEQAGQKIRSTGLLGALSVLAVGAVVSSVAVAGIWWGTANLRDESTKLRAEVAYLEKQVKEFQNKAGKAMLSSCGEKGRLCIRVDEQGGSYGDSKKGELFMIIHGY